jgi:prophage regulatory protein
MCSTASTSKPARKTRVQAIMPQEPTFVVDVPVQFWRIRQVENCSGLKKSMIYQLMNEGDFPANVKISRYTVGWLRHEVEGWVRSRVAASRSNEAMHTAAPEARAAADSRASRPI